MVAVAEVVGAASAIEPDLSLNAGGGISSAAFPYPPSWLSSAAAASSAPPVRGIGSKDLARKEVGWRICTSISSSRLSLLQNRSVRAFVLIGFILSTDTPKHRTNQQRKTIANFPECRHYCFNGLLSKGPLSGFREDYWLARSNFEIGKMV